MIWRTLINDHEQVRQIVRRWGWNGTSYQVLNPGFAFWIDVSGDAAVGYIERHQIRVVGGAPVCADDKLSGVLERFERDSALNGCGVIYFCAEQRIAELALADTRRITFPIGAQPVWSPEALLHEFAVHASLRAQLHRAQNKGLIVRHLDVLDAETEVALQSCLHQWTQDRRLPALHFLIETDTLHHLEDRRLLVAERNGRAAGFLVATPIPARNGWLIEQIVRGSTAPNGTAELLLYHAAELLMRENASFLTLGLAPLARRGEPVVDRTPAWLRGLLGWLREHGRRFYNFEGLESFKAKFGGSTWEPVYASLAPDTPIPQALLAVAGAFGGGPIRKFVPHALTHMLGQEARRAVKAARRTWH